MASFIDIVNAAPSKEAISERWTLLSMLEGLAHLVLDSPRYEDDEVLEALRAEFADTLKVHTLFDIPHDSDESCSAEVLTVQGHPVLLFKRIGDRSEYHDGLSIIDKPLARRLLQVLLDLRAREAFKKMDAKATSTAPEKALWDEVRYLTPVSNETFLVDSPKWAMGFGHNLKSHKAYFVDEDGTLVPVLRLIAWANKAPSWESNKDRHVATFETERGERTMDARNVLFTLVDDAQSLQAVAKEISQPCYWQALRIKMVRDSAFVVFGQHIKGQAFCLHGSLYIKDIETARKMHAQFNSPQAGRFDPKHASLAAYAEHIDAKLGITLSDE